jgi:hypothetical protein
MKKIYTKWLFLAAHCESATKNTICSGAFNKVPQKMQYLAALFSKCR